MVGTNVSHYRIVAPLGAGGMGIVYLAEDERLHRKVALKFLPPLIALDRDARARFEREAQTASSLDHPNIATIYEIGDRDGQPFIVMAFYEGETLKERIARGQLPVNEVLTIAEQVASGLSAAHAASIVHRDLKPANIIITRAGQVKILDFGLAKLVSDDEDAATRMTQAGTTLGTVAYMSPEQIRSADADERADVWAFGVLLYEMITGRLPFKGPNALAVMDAVLTVDAPPLRQLRPDVPPEMEHLVGRMLIKDRSARTISAADLLAEISAGRARLSGPQPIHEPAVHALFRKPSVAISLGVVILALASVVGWLVVRNANIRWAREQALPEINRLSEQEQYVAAFELARRAEQSIPNDPALAKLWPIISRTVTIRTEPSGADVFFRGYGDSSKSWTPLARSPLDAVRVPTGFFHWKVEKPGYAPSEDILSTGAATGLTHVGNVTLLFTLDPAGAAPPRMVRVSTDSGNPFTGFPTLRKYALQMPGLDHLSPVDLADYWIDKYEVTNREYKQFVIAGGYRNPKYWLHPIVKNDRTLAWRDAIALFHDTTGRPGPGTWELGTYPPGQDDYPVTGVSWYEAAAYAEFVGKELPTIFHWSKAADRRTSPYVVPLSNFAGRGPAPVGSYQGMNRYGAYDMAGNVKEWIWNEADAGKRFILGGSWDEPPYMFTDADARAPIDRDPTFGFRCIKPISAGAGSPDLRARLTFPSRNYELERPVSDEVFRAYRALYSYDKADLNVKLESRTDDDAWVREKISFVGAYGNERVIAHLFLPKHVKPPFQTILFFPGSYALTLRSSDRDIPPRSFDFIVRAGRAVMYPVLKSTYERGDDLDSDIPNPSSFWRDHVIDWSKDVGRSIDYLETRPDIATDQIGFVGSSWGAQMGAIMPAVEPRLKAVVLIVGGFDLQAALPEVEPINFAPRVRAPTLMLNGRYDFFYPTKISQEPMFRFLGASPEHKRRVVYDTGHNIPRPDMIKETLDWLDRYLGPVP